MNQNQHSGLCALGNLSCHHPAGLAGATRSDRRKSITDILRATVLLSDLTAVFASVALVHLMIRYMLSSDELITETAPIMIGKYFKQMAFFSIIIIYIMRLRGFYELHLIRHPSKILLLTPKVWFGVFTLGLLSKYLLPQCFYYYELVVWINLILIFAFIYIGRLILAGLYRNPWLAELLRLRVIILGAAKGTEQIAAQIKDENDYEIAGWIPLIEPISNDEFNSSRPTNILQLGQIRDLAAILKQYEVDAVLILPSAGLQEDTINAILKVCEIEFVKVLVVTRFFPVLNSALQITKVGKMPVLGVEQLPLDRFVNRLMKRILDVVGAIVGLFLTAPLVAVFAFLVWLESPGPVFYTQIRNGIRNRHFNIIKIRSMRLDSEENGAVWAQKNDPRRLRIGGFMRKWNIDELPQFWNVLVGDMSLVGPRPERPELVKKFQHHIPHYGLRQTHQPGMTGWAQVNGWRGNTSLEERIRHDIWYIENWSIWLDVAIMVRTFIKNKNAY
jgi:exopolysaccharide biosynthesis polyprenyl glycosylphosphotransferase